MNDFHIREARETDVDIIVRIAFAAWQPIYDRRLREMGNELYEVFFPDWRRSKESQVRGAFESPESIVCVAENDERIVGFVTCHRDNASGTAEIGNNAVHPDFQGRGIAGNMYEHIFDLLRDSGIQYVEVNTGDDPAHLPARRAYRKSGFDTHLSSVRYFRKL